MGLAKHAFDTFKPMLRKGTESDSIRAVARRQFEYAHGSYTIPEIRQAIQDGFPVVAFLKAGPALLIGEGDSLFVAKRSDGRQLEITDGALQKAWDGDALVLTADRAPERDITAEVVATDAGPSTPRAIMFSPDRDTWPPECASRQGQARVIADALNRMDGYEIPPHPMIVIFKAPSESDLNKHNRGYIEGAEAFVVDMDDPISVIFHELGHLYWSTRLTADEKAQCKELHAALNLDSLPALFNAQWTYHDEEEFFCTLYLWYLKHRVLSEGYGRIFKVQYPDGWSFLCSIFDRVKSDEAARQHWDASEPEIKEDVDQLMGKARVMRAGNRIIKARKPLRIVNAPILPASVRHTVLAKAKGREWVRIDEGLLRNQVLVVRESRLDFDFMKANKNWYKTPRRRNVSKTQKADS